MFLNIFLFVFTVNYPKSTKIVAKDCYKDFATNRIVLNSHWTTHDLLLRNYCKRGSICCEMTRSETSQLIRSFEVCSDWWVFLEAFAWSRIWTEDECPIWWDQYINSSKQNRTEQTNDQRRYDRSAVWTVITACTCTSAMIASRYVYIQPTIQTQQNSWMLERRAARETGRS